MIQYLEGDCRQVLPTLPERSVQCVVTSPPYWHQRSYLHSDHPLKSHEIGQEATPEEYVGAMVAVFRQVYRVLRNDGTLWLNLGDTYVSSRSAAEPGQGHRVMRVPTGLKPKDLAGIPWRVALGLQADGWYLRCDIIWNRTDAKPEPVKDRPTHTHEYLFLLTKSEKYVYNVDAVREPITSKGGACFGKQRHDSKGTGAQQRRLESPEQRNHPLGKNKRSVWSIATSRYYGAHFAVFPPDLVRPCILAGCPEGETVLDPFGGTGTTAMVADDLGCNAILIELNPVYLEMQRSRTSLKSLFTQ